MLFLDQIKIRRRAAALVAIILAAAFVASSQVNISGSVAVLTNAVQTLTNKTLSGFLISNTSEPSTPASGATAIYVDSADRKLKTKDEAGTIEAIGVVQTIACRVQKSTDTTLSEDAFTALTFDTESGNDNLFDLGGLHSTVTNTSRLTAVIAGHYTFHGLVQWEANATGIRLLQIRKNGDSGQIIDWQQISPASVGNCRMSLGGSTTYLNAGDYVELVAYFYFSGSGGSLKVQNAGIFSPTFGMTRIGP